MTLNKKPSSRKHPRWREFKVGDLVYINMAADSLRHVYSDPQKQTVGVIVELYSSNVYEPSAAEVMVSGKTVFLEQKSLTLANPISPEP